VERPQEPEAGAESDRTARRNSRRFFLHDLANLIAGAKGNTECAVELVQRGEPAEALAALTDALGSLRRMETLTRAAAARKPGRRTALSAAVPASLRALAHRAAAALGGLAGPGRVDVHGDVAVRCDGDQIERVFLNLIGNARRHGGHFGVRVLILRCAGEARVEVRDQGAGVTPALRARIATPVPVLLSQSQNGHGLGLAFCKRDVEGHGGRLGVVPATGGGAHVGFTLPV
jgi:signal transduction histidine kinase